MSKRFEDYAAGAQSIILAAERLIGEFGLNGVSLRQILAAAGQANTSAIQHYFGSKSGLVQAIFNMRSPLLEVARQRKLDRLDCLGHYSFEDLLRALLMPIVEIFSDDERMVYARFSLRLLPLSDAEHPYFRSLHLCPASVEINRRMLESHPLPADVFGTRIRLAVSFFLEGLRNEPRVESLGSLSYATKEIFWDDLLQMSLSALLTPFPPSKRSDRDPADATALAMPPG